MFRKAIAAAIKLLCGDFNGIQVFWAPATLLYLIDSTSVFGAIVSALGMRISYMPLIGYIFMLGFASFMLCKLSTNLPQRRSDRIDSIIRVNLQVFGLAVLAMLVFAGAAFLQYFYGLSGLLKPALVFILKVYPTCLIFFYYLYALWIGYFTKKNYSRARSKKAMYIWIRSNRMAFIKFSLFLLLLVLASVRLYELLIGMVLYPAIEVIDIYTGINLQIRLYAFNSIGHIMLNTGYLALGVMLSNLIFSPLVLLVKWIVGLLMPEIKTTRPNYA